MIPANYVPLSGSAGVYLGHSQSSMKARDQAEEWPFEVLIAAVRQQVSTGTERLFGIDPIMAPASENRLREQRVVLEASKLKFCNQLQEPEQGGAIFPS
jgi:hypothetical protein